MKIFIADDSPLIRDRLTEQIESIEAVYVVGYARDALSAVAGVINTQPDLAILDIRLPKGNGIDVLRQIKQQQPRLTCIMFTNYPSRKNKQICLEVGADYFYDKSFEFNQLTQTIKRLIKEKSVQSLGDTASLQPHALEVES